jgi:hypothetical protein
VLGLTITLAVVVGDSLGFSLAIASGLNHFIRIAHLCHIVFQFQHLLLLLSTAASGPKDATPVTSIS